MTDHTVFHSNSGKRKLLVVEDEAINRAILGQILEKDYDVIFAEDGIQALDAVRENKDFLSLVILDLIMPNMSGMEVLRRIKAEPDYQDIPVIVASGDQAQEIDCLNSGASDFIQKPYPEPGVILARVHRTIELFEGRHIIQSTERDPLTGLYNREFFYSYAEQFDLHHPGMAMDAILLDINHFGTINERYGKAYADDVLRRVAEKAREMVHDSGGIVCRREADIFQVYCPHREDYKAILDNAAMGLAGELEAGNRVRLRMGVYAHVDKTLDIERRFDRAKMAADTVRNSFTRSIGVYDDTLHKSELYSMQLIEDFPDAIEKKQFKVFYQPKYDIQSDPPVLAGAEALVRWQHPELGMVNPAVFIPLFEENGLVQALDHYVWEEAARQIREWKDTLGFTVPVSVNVSRGDMGDANIIYTLLGILEAHRLEAADLHLEVTESAYAEDSDQIIETVSRLRAVGFQVEMDDFGTGYSSLNMLSSLPIDVLKLDMKFIQTAFAQEKDVHMLGIIIEIARHLSAPVVAEGVETEEQLKVLKDLGCDMVQGYYFSAPVAKEKFEQFLLQAREARNAAQAKAGMQGRKEQKKHGERDRREPIESSASDGRSAPQEGRKGPFEAMRKWIQNVNLPMGKVSVVFVVLAFIVATGLYIADSMVTQGYLRMEHASERYILSEQAATNMEIGSDRLTEAVRSFVVTGQIDSLEAYFEEAEVTRTRDSAVANLQQLLENQPSAALDHLSAALALSNELMNQEYLAMRLILAAGAYDPARIPEVIGRIELEQAQERLSSKEKHDLAVELVFGAAYEDYKARIRNYTAMCTRELIERSNVERVSSANQMNVLLMV